MLGLNWADPRPIWVSQVAGDVRSWISQDDPSSLVLRNLGVGGRGNRRERGGLLRRGWCGGGGGQQRIIKIPFQAQTLPMPLVQATDITIWAAAPVQ